MINWREKLSSRKFWAAVAEFVTMLMIAFKFDESMVTQVSAVIMAGGGLIAWIVAEGLVDAARVGAAKPPDTLPENTEE